MNPELQRCPACNQRWPKGEEYELRSFGWLKELPRGVSPSNVDWMGFIHDGVYQRNRFLAMEAKGPHEKLPIGQERFLVGLARLPGFEVRLLRGTTASLSVFKVTRDGITAEPIIAGATAESYRRRVEGFVDGEQADKRGRST